VFNPNCDLIHHVCVCVCVCLCGTQVIETHLKDKRYDEKKVAQWVSNICESAIQKLYQLKNPFKYVGMYVCVLGGVACMCVCVCVCERCVLGVSLSLSLSLSLCGVFFIHTYRHALFLSVCLCVSLSLLLTHTHTHIHYWHDMCIPLPSFRLAFYWCIVCLTFFSFCMD